MAAIVLGLALVLALFMIGPAELPPEIDAIESVYVDTLNKEAERIVQPEILEPSVVVPAKPELKPQKPQKPVAVPQPTSSQVIPPIQQRTSVPSTPPRPRTPASSAAASQPNLPATSTPNAPVVNSPRLATAPSREGVGQGVGQGTGQGTGLPTRGAGPSGNGPSGKLGAGTMGILRARECARLGARDRPADCPPNDELLALLAKERGPQYRPENAEGFSRNELKWRDIPPPCLEDGANFKVSGFKACVRIGNVPSRVRTVQEICEARGLGGCTPTPPQAAVNAALDQVRRQEAAKAKN